MLLIALTLLGSAALSALLISLHPSRAVVRLRGTVVGFLLVLGALAAGAGLVIESGLASTGNSQASYLVPSGGHAQPR